MSDWEREIRARLAGAEIDPSREAEIVEELAQHLEDQFADHVGRGMSPADARAALLAALDDSASGFPSDLGSPRRLPRPDAQPLGGHATVRGFLANTWSDARYGWRSLLRTPTFTAVIVLSLAIVIGANTTVFGLLHSLLFRRLDLPHPEQLVAFRPIINGYGATIRYDDYLTLERTSGLQHLQAYRADAATIATSTGRSAERGDFWIDLVSGGYFDVMGVPPMLGRVISHDDEVTGAPVVVVSDDYWRQHLRADRRALGRPLLVNDVPFTLVGVMPGSYRGIFFAHAFSIAIPITAAKWFDEEASQKSVALLARVPGGADNAVMRGRASAAFRACCLQSASAGGGTTRARPQARALPQDAPVSAFGFWQDSADATPHLQALDVSRGLTWGADFRGQYRRALVALMAGVILLLLIACANVGTLLLSRAAARQREFAVRVSLGASRSRMTRQLLTESLELSFIGTVFGVVLSWAGTAILLHHLPSNALQLGDVIAWRASPAIFGFTIVTMAACSVAVGIWPARRAARADILTSLTGSSRALAQARGWRLDRMLVSAQIALALVLALGATLFVATLRNLQRSDGGYHTRRVLLARIDARSVTDSGQVARLQRALLNSVRRLPGVDDAALSFAAPVINDFRMFFEQEVPGYTKRADEPPPPFNAVSPGYFAATGIGMQRGREFDEHDRALSERVVVVSEAFARHYFANRDPIGASIVIVTKTRTQARIVGVARDAQYVDLHGPPTEMWYVPMEQVPAFVPSWFVLSIRGDIDPVSLAPSVRQAITRTEPRLVIKRIASVGQLLDDALARERFAAALASLFGIVALALAAIGVYGVIANGVARRTAEIGVRMALGAAPADALWLVMRQTLVMAGIGLGIGLPLALAAGRAIQSQLYGVGATDLRAIASATLLLATAAAFAGLLPARRAAKVDPAVALRAE